ncbi:unnamed protein product, partial [Musa textilis]
QRHEEDSSNQVPAEASAEPTGSSPASDEITFLKSNATSQPKAASSSGNARSYRFRSHVPAPPSYTAVGGKASLLPKRTPISDKEIEAILVCEILSCDSSLI